MGDERLPADDRGARRHRGPARGHVRPQAGLPRSGWSASRSARSSPAPPADQDVADPRPRPAGRRGGADALALAGTRLQRLPRRGAAAGAGDLGGGLGGGAGDRAAGRRRPDRNRLAGDLLDEPAGRRARRSRSPLAPRRSRPIPAPAPDRLAGPRAPQRRPHRGHPGAGPVARLGRGRDRRPGASSASSLCSAFWRVEHRVREPIVEFDLFRNGPTSAPAPPPSPWSAPTGR